MTTLRTRRRNLARLALTSLVAVPALAACGSDNESADGADKGDTVKVMVYGPIDAQGFSIPGLETGAQAGVDKVNEEGGFGGTELELVVCNDNNDPNAAQGCAQQAVAEDVVAVIGGISTFEQNIFPALEKAGIPVVAPLLVSSFTNSNLYPIFSGGAGGVLALGKYLAVNPECNGEVGAVQEQFNATEGVLGLFELAVSSSGATFTGAGRATQGAADFGPAVAAAAAEAGCLGVIASPQTSPQILTAEAANPDVTLTGSADSMVPQQVIAALGDTVDGFVSPNEFLPLNDSTDTPAMNEFLERGRAIDANFDPEGGAASAYLGPQVVKAALEAAGTEEITAESITNALDELKGFDTGLGPVVDFTAKNPTKAFSRLPATNKVYIWVATGGRFELSDAEPITITSVFEAAASAGQ